MKCSICKQCQQQMESQSLWLGQNNSKQETKIAHSMSNIRMQPSTMKSSQTGAVVGFMWHDREEKDMNDLQSQIKHRFYQLPSYTRNFVTNTNTHWVRQALLDKSCMVCHYLQTTELLDKSCIVCHYIRTTVVLVSQSWNAWTMDGSCIVCHYLQTTVMLVSQSRNAWTMDGTWKSL